MADLDLACRDCGERYRTRGDLPRQGSLRCRRCGAMLWRAPAARLSDPRAFALTAAILLVLANTLPGVRCQHHGRSTQRGRRKRRGGIDRLWQRDFRCRRACGADRRRNPRDKYRLDSRGSLLSVGRDSQPSADAAHRRGDLARRGASAAVEHVRRPPARRGGRLYPAWPTRRHRYRGWRLCIGGIRRRPNPDRSDAGPRSGVERDRRPGKIRPAGRRCPRSSVSIAIWSLLPAWRLAAHGAGVRVAARG